MSKIQFASSGNRTRAARVAGEHSTTEPTMLHNFKAKKTINNCGVSFHLELIKANLLFLPKSTRRAVREDFGEKAKIFRYAWNSLCVSRTLSLTTGEKMSMIRQELRLWETFSVFFHSCQDCHKVKIWPSSCAGGFRPKSQSCPICLKLAGCVAHDKHDLWWQYDVSLYKGPGSSVGRALGF